MKLASLKSAGNRLLTRAAPIGAATVRGRSRRSLFQHPPGSFAARVFCAIFLSACGWNAGAQTRDLSLLEGRGELLQFQKDIQKVAISEPKVADAVVISPREVMVNAKSPGRATLIVWETDREPARYEINITKDTAEWDNFHRQMLESADGSD